MSGYPILFQIVARKILSKFLLFLLAYCFVRLHFIKPRPVFFYAWFLVLSIFVHLVRGRANRNIEVWLLICKPGFNPCILLGDNFT